MAWRPGARSAEFALEAPYEDVPDHLIAPLWTWVAERCGEPEMLRWIVIDRRLKLPDAMVHHREARQGLQAACLMRPTLMLEIVEFLLPVFGDRYDWEDAVTDLRLMLDLGNSMYRVTEDGKNLEVRVLPEVRDEVQAVVNAADGSPGKHLATAWSEAYGRTPDPVKAYSEAIKAVESAAAPVICPTDLKATLGKMAKAVGDKPSKWEFAISATGGEGVQEVRRLMFLLWNGQTSRHGGVNPTVPETPGAALAAVHVAATLVQFFVGGLVTVRESPVQPLR